MDSLQEEWATRFARLEALLTLGSCSAEKPVFSPVKLQVPHSAASVVVSDAPFFDSSAGTSGPAALAEDLDEPVPVDCELDMSMKSTLADLYSPGPVPGDQEPVINTGISDPSNSSTMQPVQEEEEGELTGSELETPQETEPGVSEDQSYREIIRGIRAYMKWNFVPDLEVFLEDG